MGKANYAIEALRANSGLAQSPEWQAFAQAAQSAGLDAGTLKAVSYTHLTLPTTPYV